MMEANAATHNPVPAAAPAVEVSGETTPAAPTAHERIDQFKADISKLEVKVPEDKTERSFLFVGIGLLIVGGLVIFGGYWGASGTAKLNEQIPYLLSGGLLGLGLMVAGSALFVRYSLTRFLRFWMIRDIYEQRSQTDRIVESMNGVEELLRAATRPRPKSD
jgi:hypothetical protein